MLETARPQGASARPEIPDTGRTDPFSSDQRQDHFQSDVATQGLRTNTLIHEPDPPLQTGGAHLREQLQQAQGQQHNLSRTTNRPRRSDRRHPAINRVLLRGGSQDRNDLSQCGGEQTVRDRGGHPRAPHRQ